MNIYYTQFLWAKNLEQFNWVSLHFSYEDTVKTLTGAGEPTSQLGRPQSLLTTGSSPSVTLSV